MPDASHGPRRLTAADLESTFGAPEEAAVAKLDDRLGLTARRFIAHSPFVCVASSSGHGADCSPRGDGPGFAKVIDDTTLALPDRTGNNLADTFRNVVRQPQVGLLFLVPGVTETLRVNGRAFVTDDAQLLARFEVDERPVRLALVVEAQEVYFHCGKALIRSELWRNQDLSRPATWGSNVFAMHATERPTSGIAVQELNELLRDGYLNGL